MALEEIAKLQELINKNSKNRPLQTKKPNTSSIRRKKGRTGRGPSYPPERVNRHVRCTRENCPHCSSSAIHLTGQSPEIIQQAELPEVQAIVTEYQLLTYSCGACGQNSSGSLPTGICKYTLNTFDVFVRRRLRAILCQRHKRRGCGRGHKPHQQWPNEFFVKYGLHNGKHQSSYCNAPVLKWITSNRRAVCVNSARTVRREGTLPL